MVGASSCHPDSMTSAFAPDTDNSAARIPLEFLAESLKRNALVSDNYLSFDGFRILLCVSQRFASPPL